MIATMDFWVRIESHDSPLAEDVLKNPSSVSAWSTWSSRRDSAFVLSQHHPF